MIREIVGSVEGKKITKRRNPPRLTYFTTQCCVWYLSKAHWSANEPTSYRENHGGRFHPWKAHSLITESQWVSVGVVDNIRIVKVHGPNGRKIIKGVSILSTAMLLWSLLTQQSWAPPPTHVFHRLSPTCNCPLLLNFQN